MRRKDPNDSALSSLGTEVQRPAPGRFAHRPPPLDGAGRIRAGALATGFKLTPVKLVDYAADQHFHLAWLTCTLTTNDPTVRRLLLSASHSRRGWRSGSEAPTHVVG